MKAENTDWAGTYSSMLILGSATKSYIHIYMNYSHIIYILIAAVHASSFVGKPLHLHR